LVYTLDDFVKRNPNYSKRYDPASKTAYVKNSISGKEIGFQSGQGQEYGMGGLQNGSNIVSDVNKLTGSLGTTENKPNTEYKSPYSEDISKALFSYNNRSPFSYNPGADAGLQNAQNNAIDNVSRAAARKGMLYSDSNKASMNKAALDVVPQFEQAAFNRYQAENSDLYNRLSVLQNLDNSAYNRFSSDRSYAAGRADSNQSQQNWDKTFGEGQRQFDAGQQNWNKSFLENQRQFNVGQQNWQKEMTFKQKQAEIDNAVSNGQLSIAQSQLLLSKAKWDAENDPESLDNQIKKAQLSGYNASTAQTLAETDNIKNGLTPSGGLPSGTQPTESEAKRAEEVKLQTKLDTFVTTDKKGNKVADKEAQKNWIKSNKSNIISTFGREYYKNLADEYYIVE
jgi:hypothetical protein